jgi:hypothetical protein
MNEPTLDTAAELDQLPLGSVILDAGGMARQIHAATCGENWWSEAGTGVEHDLTSTDLIRQFDRDGVSRQVVVLWAPTD